MSLAAYKLIIDSPVRARERLIAPRNLQLCGHTYTHVIRNALSFSYYRVCDTHRRRSLMRVIVSNVESSCLILLPMEEERKSERNQSASERMFVCM